MYIFASIIFLFPVTRLVIKQKLTCNIYFFGTFKKSRQIPVHDTPTQATRILCGILAYGACVRSASGSETEFSYVIIRHHNIGLKHWVLSDMD